MNHKAELAAPRIMIFRRSDLPLHLLGTDGLAVDFRPFHAHELLKGLVPSPGDVTFAWSDLRPGQELPARSHAMSTLIIVVGGSARLTGVASRLVSTGDVVMIPRHQEYGLDTVGPLGFSAIHVSFSAASDTVGEVEATTLESLLARNHERGLQILQNPFYVLVANGALANPTKRELCRSCVQMFSDVFQTILFTRQATCRDSPFQTVFLAHFLEEQGHNEMLGRRHAGRESRDPIVAATANWFSGQMLMLDNVEKAVLVNLVLETSGYYFHSLAKKAFEHDAAREYFNVHADNDERHRDMALEVLEGHHPDTYRRLNVLLDQGWDMFDAMARRWAWLVERGAATP